METVWVDDCIKVTNDSWDNKFDHPLEDIVAFLESRKTKEQIVQEERKEKLDKAIVLLSEATDMSMAGVAQAFGELAHTGAKTEQAVESFVNIFNKIDIYLVGMIEQNKTKQKAQQKANKAYYNKLLLKMSTEYSFSVKERSTPFKLNYNRRCDMQLKTCSNLRF